LVDDPADVTETLFQELSAALVILARFATMIELFTKYAVPISVEVTAAFSDDRIDPEVKAAVGALVSTMNDLFAAKDPAPAGEGNVKVAAEFVEFLIVPLFSASELVAT
jgi:hypothetical protein